VTNKLIRGLLIAVSLIAIVANWPAISVGAEKVAHKFLVVVHGAALYAKAPDEKLEMPVQGVSKSQVADSWHVPREGDRLHEGQDIFASVALPFFPQLMVMSYGLVKKILEVRPFQCLAPAAEFTTTLT
jgi:hypothetical protein